MRVKHILERLQLNHKIRIVYERVTLTRFTLIFVIVAIVGCLAQIGVQGAALAQNSKALASVDAAIRSAGQQPEFAFIKNNILFVCTRIPKSGNPYDAVCYELAGSGPSNDDNVSSKRDALEPNIVQPRTLTDGNEILAKVTDDEKDDDEKDEDESTVLDDDTSTVNITGQDEQVSMTSMYCVKALNWPHVVLHDAKREDVSFLVFQLWLLGISFVSVLNESTPHLIATVITHGLATAWSAFQIARTGHYRTIYESLIVTDACDGLDIFPGFWTNRIAFFIPILVINALTLIATTGIAMKLIKVYTRKSFERVDGSSKMNARYIWILLFSVHLQLSAFFIIIGSALWLDAVFTTVSDNSKAYEIIFIIVCVVEIPWVVLGWKSVRKESFYWSMIFIVIGFVISGAWTSMFASVLYSWSFQNFPFLATITISAFVILIFTLGLALICQRGFGKGLPQYLKSNEKFDEGSFIPVLIPKPPSRRSRLISVVFPDKRFSALRKKLAESRTSTTNNSVIDIRDQEKYHPSLDASLTDEQAKIQSPFGLPSHSSPDRARTPFSRWSNFSKSSRHLSSSASSIVSDYERGVVEHADVIRPPVPVLPKFVPGPALHSAHTPERRLSNGPPYPAINVIPASVSKLMSLDQRALHSRTESEGSLGGYKPLMLASQGSKPSSPSKGRVGLPMNPRAYR